MSLFASVGSKNIFAIIDCIFVFVPAVHSKNIIGSKILQGRNSDIRCSALAKLMSQVLLELKSFIVTDCLSY